MLLTVTNLTKRLQGKEILKNISISIDRSEVVGIVGPNGSGKTTLFNILARTISADEGIVQFAEDLRYDYVISRSEFFGDMSVKDNLKLRSYLSKSDYNLAANNLFEIDYFDKPFKALSAGMKQKVSLTIPFLGARDLILLDEPTNHLDIDSIISLRSKILQLKQQGVSFLIASHGFSELEKICDRIIFIKKGVILHDERSSDLLLTYADLEIAYTTLVSARTK